MLQRGIFMMCESHPLAAAMCCTALAMRPSPSKIWNQFVTTRFCFALFYTVSAVCSYGLSDVEIAQSINSLGQHVSRPACVCPGRRVFNRAALHSRVFSHVTAQGAHRHRLLQEQNADIGSETRANSSASTSCYANPLLLHCPTSGH